MRHLPTLLAAILLAVSLGACGTQAETGVPTPPGASAAPSVPSGSVDELMAQARALAKNTNDLGMELWEGQMFEVVLAPDAAAAKPELAKARALVDEMASNEKTIVALLEQVVRLDPSEELTTYAGQQKEIAELQLLGIASEVDLLKEIEVMYQEQGKPSEADLETLFTEVEPFGPDDPLVYLEEKGRASREYFRQSGLPEKYYINNGLGQAYDSSDAPEESELMFPVPLAEGVLIVEGPMTTEEVPPPKMWGSFEAPLEEAVQAQRSLLEGEGWSVKLGPAEKTRAVMTARKDGYTATITFRQEDGPGSGRFVVRVTQT